MAVNAVLVGTRGTSGSNTVSTGAGTTQATGSTFLICTSFDPGVTDNTPTDSKSNTYTRIGTAQTGNAKVTMYKCENGTGGASHSATHTFSGSAFPTCHLIEITGALAASFDQTAQGIDGSGSPWTLTSPTLSQANEVVVAMVESNGSGGANGDYSSSNFTILSSEPDFSNFWTSGVAKLVVAATTAVTPSFTRANENTSATCGLILATFKEGAAAAATKDTEQPNRTRPGRGPFSKGKFYVADTAAYTSVPSGAISGTAGLTFGQSAILTATGALAGSSALALGQSGTLTGAGALAGPGALTFAQSGLLKGTGTLAGTLALILGQSGALTAAGALGGTAALTMGQVGALTAAGSLAGTSAIVIAQTGTLTQPGLNGATALTFGQTGVLAATGALGGTSAITFGSTGLLKGSGALNGSSGLALSQTGAATGAGALAGLNGLTWGQSGALTGAGALSGAAALVFGQSGTLLQPGLNGTSALSFAQAGSLGGSGALAGSAAVALSGAGALKGFAALVANSQIIVGQTGTLTGAIAGSMTASAGISWSGTASLLGFGALAGTSALIFSQQGLAVDVGVPVIPAPSVGQAAPIQIAVFDYQEVAIRVNRLLQRYGFAVALSKPVRSDYEAETGSADSLRATTDTGFAIRDPDSDYQLSFTDGTRERVEFAPFWVSMALLVPEPGDSLSMLGKVWTIESATPIAPGGVNVLHKVLARNP